MPKNQSTNHTLEQAPWAAADKLRGHLDAAEYKHVVLGLIFLEYISDAFEEKYHQLELWTSEPAHEYYVKEPRARYITLLPKLISGQLRVPDAETFCEERTR